MYENMHIQLFHFGSVICIFSYIRWVLSHTLILKLPESYGVEYSSPHQPQNGRLQILGSASGQFAHIDYQPEIKERDFYIFPYDMRHCVYPFNGPGMRRTLAANCDVDYNPINNRGVS